MSAAIVSALLVLILASSASAECAWVLWQEMTPLGGDSVWRILTAVPTYTDCRSQVAAMRAGVKEMRSAGRAVERTPEGMVEKEFHASGFNATATVWQCLPDTVDPRGAKGK